MRVETLGSSDAACTIPQICEYSGFRGGITHCLQEIGTTEVLSHCKVTMHKRAGNRNKDAQPKLLQTPEEEQLAKQQFGKLTEAASTLVNSGETDVYTQRKVLNPLLHSGHFASGIPACFAQSSLAAKHVQYGKRTQLSAMRSPHR